MAQRGDYMFNFSGIDHRGRLGRILRLPLCLVPKNMVMRICQGKLRGKKWIVGSFNHGCWLGSYEFEKQNLIAKMVSPGAVFYDVGAHVGFYTLLASSLVQKIGKVFAFEPFPKNIEYLEKHLMMNGVENVTLFKAAVSDHAGETAFQEGPGSSMGQISERGELVVELVALDDLFHKGLLPLPYFIKIDVEGAELSVLTGARHMLTVGRPTIFLATHGTAVHLDCLSLLRSLGYTCVPLDNTKDIRSCDEIMATKQNIPMAPNPHG
jgi:FkbM family methyltransferase